MLALAETETLMLTLALADAAMPTEAHESDAAEALSDAPNAMTVLVA
jgi:hypothetical protein